MWSNASRTGVCLLLFCLAAGAEPDAPEGEEELSKLMASGRKAFEEEYFVDAETHWRAALDMARELPAEDRRLLDCHSGLGRTLYCLCRDSVAVDHASRAQALAEKHHPLLVLNALDLLSLVNARIDPQRSLDFRRRAAALSARQIGKEHPDTLQRKARLVVPLARASLLDEAYELHREVYRAYLRIHGSEHEVIAQNFRDWSNVLIMLDQVDDARNMAERSLDMAEKVCGKEHSATADALYTLGMVELSAGDVECAEPLLRRALSVREKLDGNELELADDRMSFARFLQRERRLKEAIELFALVLPVYERSYGPTHPSTIDILEDLAFRRRELGQIEASLEDHRRLHSLLVNSRGRADPQTLRAQSWLAQTEHLAGNLKKAEVLARDLVALCDKHGYSVSRSMVWGLAVLFEVLSADGRKKDALPIAVRRAGIVDELDGPTSAYTARCHHHVAVILRDLGRHEEAEPEFRRAIEIYENFPYLAHRAAFSVNGLAMVLRALGRAAEAENHARRGLEMHRDALKPEDSLIGHTLTTLAEILLDLGKLEEAEKTAREGLAIQNAALEDDHEDVVRAVKVLVKILARKR